MKARFILTMEDLIVHGKHFDSVTIDFEEETMRDRVLVLSKKWMASHPFLVPRMEGLYEVGKSSLTIEPVEADFFE